MSRKAPKAKGVAMMARKAITPEAEVSTAQWARIQEWLIHPQVEEVLQRNDLTKVEFVKFCEDRFKRIKSRLLANLGY